MFKLEIVWRVRFMKYLLNNAFYALREHIHYSCILQNFFLKYVISVYLLHKPNVSEEIIYR